MNPLHSHLKEVLSELRATGDQSFPIWRIEVSPEWFGQDDIWSSFTDGPQFRWRDRHQNQRQAFGCIWRWNEAQYDWQEALDDIVDFLEDSIDDLTVYGGLAFDPLQSVTSEWQAFGQFLFFIPRWEVCHLDYSPHVYLNGVWEDLEDIDRFLKEHEHVIKHARVQPVPQPQSSFCLDSRLDTPDQSQWVDLVNRVHRDMAADDVQKVVLARRSRLKRASAHPLAWHRYLLDQRKDSFVYAFLPNTEYAFVGASPERLYYRLEERISTEALASTLSKRPDASHHQFKDNMKQSPKLMKEHDCVRQWLNDQLTVICDGDVRQNKLEIVEWNNSYHLRTKFSGSLQGSFTDADVIRQLHPTPAVGGLPKQGIWERLRTYEPFSRGWYAGPLGWISQAAAEWTVSIRSILFTPEEVICYAGAGLVAESDPIDEWEEIEHKMNSILNI
jgi:menaquinone-specific isochorismate synthase